MKIRLVMLGKTKRPEIRALLDDYLARIAHSCPIFTTEIRRAPASALARLNLDPAAHVVLLDAAGRNFSSQEFARWLSRLREVGTHELVFVCGDDAGFPADFRRRARESLSLSRLTMPHELARVLLAEQIYRAFAILAGHPYAK